MVKVRFGAVKEYELSRELWLCSIFSEIEKGESAKVLPYEIDEEI
jgi:hypothetical protein